MRNLNINLGTELRNNNHRIMLFDLARGGHHPSYIKHIVNYWCDEKLPFNLDIVVSPKFINEHSDVVKIPIDRNQLQIRFTPITREEYAGLINTSYLLQKIFLEWELYCKYAKDLNIDHCLLMYLDTLQLPIAFGKKSPCSFSGIYFRPTFHYSGFENYVFSWHDYFRQWRQKLLIELVLRKPQFKNLFSLDPFVVKHLERFKMQAQILHLPDPVECHKLDVSKLVTLRKDLNIDSNRKIFLLFGSLHARKGLHKVLAAIRLLPVNICENICLLVVGKIPSEESKNTNNQIKDISLNLPIQIIMRNTFVPDIDVHTYFHLSDIVLAPYQKHVGMSGILLLAAAAKKPVLASNYGLMGQLVRKKKLGIAVDSSSSQAIATAMINLISNDQIQEKFFDVKSIDEFVEENIFTKFSSTLFANM